MEWDQVAVIDLFHDHDVSRPPATHNAREILEQIGKDRQISVHDHVPQGTSPFEAGMISEVANLPHSEIRLDQNTFRVEASGTGGASLAKAVDHILLYRSANLTSQNGGDYFVIMSGDGQYGRWGCHLSASSCTAIDYYDRSIVIRTFKGVKPAGFPRAFEARSILENLTIDLPVQAENEAVTVEELSQGMRKAQHKTARALPGNVDKWIHCPTDGLWSGQSAKEQLEVGLLYRCAEQTLREGYEYFVFEKKDKRTQSWHDLISGAFEVEGYGGGPVFRKPYEKDRTMHGIWAKIRLVPHDAVADEPFAFRANEVLSYLAPVLKTMSEETTH